MQNMSDIAVCSICSRNYFAHARVLFDSVRRQHPDWDCHLLLADELDGVRPEPGDAFSLMAARELGIPGFAGMAFRYDVIELNVALKPFLMRYLLSRGYKRVVYFDVDICLFSPLTPILTALDSASIVITPHITSPLPAVAGSTIREDYFLKNGAFNLGFIAVSQCPESGAFLDWWAARCLTQCFRETETGLFVDQKWVDLVPGFFPATKILRDHGCNMAYWNLHERSLSGNIVNGAYPLVFFHFSGVDLSDISSISKYQAEYNLSNRPDLLHLFTDYRDRIIAAGHEKYKDIPYHYGRFKNGQPIGLVVRRLYEWVESEYDDPFEVGSGTFHERVRHRGLLSVTTAPIYKLSDAKKRGRPINAILKALARIFGVRRYEALMTYLRHISVLRRQKFLIE